MTARAKSRSAEGATPSMQQYFSIKEDYPDALLFFRMGDFYELFFEDAEQAAQALDITLTKRGQHQGKPIPMCGVPAHSHEGYLQTLIRKGFKVAICEQMENPAEAKKRGYKAVVKRDVVRLVTPGTLTEDTLLSARQNNYLAAYAQVAKGQALAWLDLSTGQLRVVTPDDLASWLAQIAPQEVLVQSETEAGDMFEGLCITPLSPASFHPTSAHQRLLNYYDVTTLDAFGTLTQAHISALGAILDYVSYTQKAHTPHLSPPQVQASSAYMRIDPATRRNLEMMLTLSGERRGSLLHLMDTTRTSAGARLLADRLQAPLTDPQAIEARLESVKYFTQFEADVATLFWAMPDVERALNRISLARGGPRDLQALQKGLTHARDIHALFVGATELPVLLEKALNALKGHSHFIDHLHDMLAEDDLPVYAKDGNFIRAGADATLDDMRQLRDNGRRVILELEAKYKRETKINALKIKFNNVLGYFIEIPTQHGDLLMQDSSFHHRQTLVNCIRFTTQELSELEHKIIHARDAALSRELVLFEELCAFSTGYAPQILAVARGVAELDVAHSLAEQATQKNWVRPTVDTSRTFEVCGGRHPVVEASLQDKPFIANDCNLTEHPAWVLTGPNMAGKSTFLRQNALFAVMAQMGSFVPAKSAHIGVVDQLFSRVGASDDLARGRSTFMVEMVETAAILNQAGRNALVILDEIGRGTATYDGLSIAWATLEHLHDVNRCRTLFATHYHELTVLQDTLPGVINANVKVREWNNSIIFLHEVVKGAADRSYGVQVARLAGLPASVIKRAKGLLAMLEAHKQEQEQLPLFSMTAKASEEPESNPLQDYLEALNPDELSPKQALEVVYHLKDMFEVT